MKLVIIAAVCALLAACGGSLINTQLAAGNTTATPPPPPPPPPGSCLPGDPADARELTRLNLVSDSLTFCRAELDGDRCYAFDLAHETLAPYAGWADARHEVTAFDRRLRVSDDAKRIEHCTPDQRCRPVAVPRGFTAYSGAVSGSGQLVALSLEGSGRSAGNWIQLYALPSGKAGKRFKVEHEHFGCMRGGFVGETLLVQLDVCAGPAGRAWLADGRTGKKIADVGGPDFGAWSLHEQPLGGDLWAFREERGVEVVVHNVRTGAIVRRIDLTETLPRTESGEPDVDPSLGAMFVSHRDDLVVVHDGPGQGTVVIVDPTAGTVVHVARMPRCRER